MSPNKQLSDETGSQVLAGWLMQVLRAVRSTGRRGSYSHSSVGSRVS
jgi:hypothetical protein